MNLLRRWIWYCSCILALAFPASAQTITTPPQIAIGCAFNSAVPTLATGSYGLVQCNSTGALKAELTSTFFTTSFSSHYPIFSTALQGSSGNVANAAAVATLTSAVGRTAFISGLELTASGATAGLPVVATVTGLLGGTRSIVFVFPAGVLIAATPIIISFDPPLQASAANTNIVVTLPAGGAGNTNAAASANGYMI